MKAPLRVVPAVLAVLLSVRLVYAAAPPDTSSVGNGNAPPDTAQAAAPVDTAQAPPVDTTQTAPPDTTRAAIADTSRALADTLAARPDTLRKVAPADSVHDALVAALSGSWAGTAEHDNEKQLIALDLAPREDGRMDIHLSMPVVHLDRVPMGRGRPIAQGDSIQLGEFRFAFDRAQGTLSGDMPSGLVPYYRIPFHLKRGERLDAPARAPLDAPAREVAWSFDAGSPVWAGPTYADGAIYLGDLNGDVIALDASNGSEEWRFHSWGAIRARPTWYKGMVFVQADDGDLYCIDGRRGLLRWKKRINDRKIERLPFDDPKTKYDRFSSDVTVDGDRLFVGTHDGKLLALKVKDGSQIWEFDADNAILAAPAIEDGLVIFGSYDHFVYAVSEKSGEMVWRHDTHGAVVSTPALFGDRLVVGNRVYDLLGLDVKNGRETWKDYQWMSWVESSATANDGVAYVGSSDATTVSAFEGDTGKRLWVSDVRGWSWGQPAVGDRRVYAGVSSEVGYGPDHEGSAMALDRETGKAVWRFAAPKPDSGAYGFAGSPALGPDLVYFAGLDGKVYAFDK